MNANEWWGEIGKEKNGIKGEENPVLSHIKVIIIQMLKLRFKDIVMGNQRRRCMKINGRICPFLSAFCSWTG